MDLDLAQVRAFLAAAERLHFGQAAQELSLSQQAVSKRVARLEGELGLQLFRRGGQAVELTDAGRRFLDPARRVLSAAERAVAAAREVQRPLRIDVWGHLFAPMRTLHAVLDQVPELTAEVGPARDLAQIQDALTRRTVDIGFGRVHPPAAAPAGTPEHAHRLVRLEPVDAVVGPDHPLAGRSQARPQELGTGVLWCPAALSRLEFYRRFAERFAIRTHSGAANLGLEPFLGQLAEDPMRFALLPADLELPPRARVFALALTDPTPLYAWSLIWPSADPHPHVPALLRAFADVGGRSRWLEYRPGQDWLPDGDLADDPPTEAR